MTRRPQGRPLRIGGVPEHFNLPWKLAIKDGAFETAGIDLRYSEHPAGTGELTRALRDNELDVALVLTEGAVQDVINNDVSRLVKVFAASPLVWGIYVAAGSNIKGLRDIRGRPVAISRFGSGSHLISIVDALQRGWEIDEMSFVVIDNLDGARKALAHGNADVFLWERHMTQPYVDNGEFRRVGKRVVPWPAFVVSARRDVLANRANELRSVLDITVAYARRLKRSKSGANLIAESYGLKLAGARAWLAEVRWSGSYRRPASALSRVVEALQAQQAIPPGAVSPDRLWHQL